MKRIIIFLMALVMLCTFAGCAKEEPITDLFNGDEIMTIMTTLEIKGKLSPIDREIKGLQDANPLSSVLYCADPTAVEYNGRLYVYGTNDQQQYLSTNHNEGNSYEFIRSLVVFSTDDMVNWTYHGEIPVGEIAPWIYQSWAPSIVSRVEDDGKTHFYLYFSNGGAGVGVITSTDPVTGWTDPLGEPLIYQNMPGLENCPAPFDPGVCIDENGVGWLSFGGGAPGDTPKVHSNVPKVVKLGEDMLSFDSEFVSIDAPYFFEASELNYFNGTYYYTYCTGWQSRELWKDETMYEGIEAPDICSMAYMTSKTPLAAESWEYQDDYFLNAFSTEGMNPSNNHTHLEKFKDKWYMIHHTGILCDLQGFKGGHRSIGIEEMQIDENGPVYELLQPTFKGVEQIANPDAFLLHKGAELANSIEMRFVDTPESRVHPVSVYSDAHGAWTMMRGVDFKVSPSSFLAVVSGTGTIEVRIDDRNSDPVAAIRFYDAESVTVQSNLIESAITGEHDVYLVFSHSGITLEGWQFR